MPPVPDWRHRTSFLYASGAVRAGLTCTGCHMTYRRCTERLVTGAGACCIACRDHATHDEVTIAPAHDSVESFPADTTDAMTWLRACIAELTKIVEDWPR